MKHFSKGLLKMVLSLVLVCLAFSCVSFGVALSEQTYALNGGAIYLASGATYNKKGGRISGSTGDLGGAVYISNQATFNMTGGTITNCHAADGGALYIANGGTANISNGTITGNTADNGSGIYVSEGGTLNLTGGTVENDIYVVGAMAYGGGSVSGNITLTGAEQLTINAVPSSALKITTTQTAVGTKLAKINDSNFTTSKV